MQLRKIFLAFFLVMPWFLVKAQFAQLHGYVGTSLFPKGSQNELLAGFKPGITIGAGASKTIHESFVYNPNLEFTASSKEHYTFSLISIHNNFKYYPWLVARVRPYVMGIVNLSFVNLHQQAYETTVNPDPSYSGTDPSNIPVSQITYREPDMKLSFAPTIGWGGGLGFDVVIRLKVVPFIQYSYTSYLTQSSNLINDNFRNNLKNLSTQNIVVGVRYNLYQSLKK